MNALQTDDIIALSLLLDEPIYVINEPELTIANTEIIVAPALPEKQEHKAPEKAPLIIPTIETQKADSIPVKSTSFEYLGENNKYILIIVNDTETKFINKDNLAFLEKILGAKKWALDDVAIVNLAKYDGLAFEDLKAYFACSKIITFGFNPTILKISGAVANQKLSFNGVAVLGTWDLSSLRTDVVKKTTFWNQLKNF